MAENTKIQWCHHTWNPYRGCTKVSPGCANCYAEAGSKRNPGVLGVWGPQGTRVVASEAMWREPLKWDAAAAKAGERHRVFCASLADVFEDWQGGKDYPDEMVNARGGRLSVNAAGQIWSYQDGPIDDDWGVRAYTMDDVRMRLFRLIDKTPNLDWLLLTKRPENVRRMTDCWIGANSLPRSVWLGVSVEDQQRADERIPHLLRTPAAVRFLSVEPLLGPVDLSKHLQCESCLDRSVHWCVDPVIHWVIIGGESGHNARPCDVQWIRSLVSQCQAAHVSVFVKQLGAVPSVRVTNGVPADTWQLSDPKGGDPAEWPADLRVREFPVCGQS